MIKIVNLGVVDIDEPLGFTQSAADLSDRVFERPDSLQDSTVAHWFANNGP